MRINEIERIDPEDWEGGKQALNKGMPVIKNAKKLPGSSGLLYSIDQGETRGVIDIALWDPAKKPMYKGAPGMEVGRLELIELPRFEIPGAVAVSTITVDEDYRGQGLSTAMYKIVLKRLMRPLVAGDAQTPGGRRNWVSIANIPGVQIKGYARLEEDDLMDKDNIDVIMGKLGGEISHNERSGDYFVTFDVMPSTTGQELEAYIKTNLSKVYDEPIGMLTGLYAQWTGE